MGQYYLVVILDDSGKIIRTWFPQEYGGGIKLMEHSYFFSNYIRAVEFMLSPDGMFCKSALVWAGDYADNEDGSAENLYAMAFEMWDKACYKVKLIDTSMYRYIINHTKKLYVDKNHSEKLCDGIHPLPLLTVEGNGRGGGDYSGSRLDLVGTWARDLISVEKELPAVGFTELVCDFSEG
jgi:hypothetical protein